MSYYNFEHRHSGIGWHTPATVHDGAVAAPFFWLLGRTPVAGPRRHAPDSLHEDRPRQERRLIQRPFRE